MARSHQSIRLDLQDHQLIAAEMAHANITESEAIRRLIRRGAGLPNPVYFKTQLSNSRYLKTYCAESEKWRHIFATIRSQLRSKLPVDADEELTRLVHEWRAIADKLQPEALRLGAVAEALAQKMMGISLAELAELRHAKQYMLDTADPGRSCLFAWPCSDPASSSGLI